MCDYSQRTQQDPLRSTLLSSRWKELSSGRGTAKKKSCYSFYCGMLLRADNIERCWPLTKSIGSFFPSFSKYKKELRFPARSSWDSQGPIILRSGRPQSSLPWTSKSSVSKWTPVVWPKLATREYQRYWCIHPVRLRDKECWHALLCQLVRPNMPMPRHKHHA